MTSANGASRAQEDQPAYAVPLLRLTAEDVEEMARARLDQRHEEMALSADEVFEKLRSLNRVADWIRSARPAG